MKHLATSDFSQIETVASKKGYIFVRSYFDKVPIDFPTQTQFKEFMSKDGSSKLVQIITLYYGLDEIKGGKLSEKPNHISRAIKFSFNDQNLVEKYKAYLNNNKYKNNGSYSMLDRMSTKYNIPSDKSFDVTIIREEKMQKFNYHIYVDVNPLQIKVE